MTICNHVLVYILVTNLGLLVLDANLIKSLVKAKVTHYCCNNLVVCKGASLLEVESIDVDDVVTSYNVTLLIYCKASVSITVKGKSDIQALLNNKLLQMLDMS